MTEEPRGNAKLLVLTAIAFLCVGAIVGMLWQTHQEQKIRLAEKAEQEAQAMAEMEEEEEMPSLLDDMHTLFRVRHTNENREVAVVGETEQSDLRDIYWIEEGKETKANDQAIFASADLVRLMSNVYYVEGGYAEGGPGGFGGFSRGTIIDLGNKDIQENIVEMTFGETVPERYQTDDGTLAEDVPCMNQDRRFFHYALETGILFSVDCDEQANKALTVTAFAFDTKPEGAFNSAENREDTVLIEPVSVNNDFRLDEMLPSTFPESALRAYVNEYDSVLRFTLDGQQYDYSFQTGTFLEA